MKNLVLKISFLALILLPLVSCERNPIGKLIDSKWTETLNYRDYEHLGYWPDEWVIYDDDVKIARNNFDPSLFTDWIDLGHGSLDLNCQEVKYKGVKSIKMEWDGAESTPFGYWRRLSGLWDWCPPGALQWAYVGFAMLAKGAETIVPGQDPPASYVGYDMTQGSYTVMTCWVRAERIHSNVQIEIKAAIDIDDNPAGVVYLNASNFPDNKTWIPVIISLNAGGNLARVHNVFAISLKLINESHAANGAKIYIDEIRHEK